MDHPFGKEIQVCTKETPGVRNCTPQGNAFHRNLELNAKTLFSQTSEPNA